MKTAEMELPRFVAAGSKPDRGGVEGTEQGLEAEELQGRARQGSRLVGVFLKAASLAQVARPAGALKGRRVQPPRAASRRAVFCLGDVPFSLC